MHIPVVSMCIDDNKTIETVRNQKICRKKSTDEREPSVS